MRQLILLIFFVFCVPLCGEAQPVKLVRSPKSVALAKAFISGKLPEPMRLPQGNIDQQATALAKAVSKGDESSTAALYAAILASGYGVRDSDGSVLQTTQRGQGFIYEASEVAAISKLYGEGYGVTLQHLSDSFVRSVPAFKNVPLQTALLEGIRVGAKSDHPAVRFWSRFIVELGRNSDVPYDLLAQVDPAKTRLDAVQVALILKRLAGDLAALQKPQKHHAIRRNMQSPCGASEVGDLVLDYNALASTTLFGFLTNRLGGAAANYSEVAGVANVVLTVFKFIASYAALNVEISMDADKLVRTKDTKPGERHTLTAKLRMDTGKWQQINCLRPILNSAGLDVDLPDNGPLSGVNVVWRIVLGGDSRGWFGTVQDFFEILGGGEPAGDGIVYFEAIGGADRSPANQYTDKEGVSQIYIVGAPQEKDLSRRKLFEVMKGAGVRVDVQLKPMRIKDVKEGLSNIMDIAGNAFSFLTEDPIGGGVGTVTETLYRSNWYSSQPFYFLVKDWEPCTGQWQGTITYIATMKEEGSAENLTVKHSWHDESYYEARAQLDGRRDNLGAPIARVQAHASQYKELDGTGKGECYRVNKQIQEAHAEDSATTTGFSVSLNPRTGRYSVSAPIIVVTGSGQYTVTSEVKGACRNPFNKDLHQTNPQTNVQLSPDGPVIEGEGTVDPNNPDVISGSNTLTVPTNRGGERKVTITWNLKRCQDQ
ncbi:MAG TPA: hypothetical protein VEV42_14470 [Pyrinomonadaceae bacterium]|nr:hypothetical protein [Pyrinomonadaceae bacterium]